MKSTNILFFLAALLLLSCDSDNKKYYLEYYPSGNIKYKAEMNNDSLFNGTAEEYYDTGELLFKTTFSNGVNNDSAFFYYRNGRVMKKGLFRNKNFFSWWIEYDTIGNIISKKEYLNSNNFSEFGIKNSDSIFINQAIFYKKGVVDSLSSSFFEMLLPDTLCLGNNKIKLALNSNYKDYCKNYDSCGFLSLFVILKNQHNKLDTLNSRKPVMSIDVQYLKVGEITIKGEIVEQDYYIKNHKKDSLSDMNVLRINKFFEKKVYVKDSVK